MKPESLLWDTIGLAPHRSEVVGVDQYAGRGSGDDLLMLAPVETPVERGVDRAQLAAGEIDVDGCS